MAATACAAYAYRGTRPPLMPPATPPARPLQLPQPSFDVDDHDGCGAGAGMPASPAPPPPLPPPPLPRRPTKAPPSRHLGLCTEGLGSESSSDVDLGEVIDGVENDDASIDDVLPVPGGQALPCKRQHRDGDEEPALARNRKPAFPPPISVIGAGGKPWLYLRPHRADGRLVLREVKIPARELLQARREDGRFKLQFAHPEEDESADAMVKEQGQRRTNRSNRVSVSSEV